MLLGAMIALIALAGPAFAQIPLGAITAYKPEMLRVYSQTGVRLDGQRSRADLPPLPTTIVAIGDGGQLGVRSGNTNIFLRGMDVDFTLNEAGRARIGCSQVSAGVRPQGAVVPGPRAGGGSSDDCLVRGTGQ